MQIDKHTLRDALPQTPRPLPFKTRMRNLCGTTFINSPVMRTLLALLMFAFSVQIWSGADWSPILFTLFRPVHTTGVVISVVPTNRWPSDGSTWEVRFEYLQVVGHVRTAASWAPTLDSKPGLFWKAFAKPVVGSTVVVEELRTFGIARISKMRTGCVSMDGALGMASLMVLLIWSAFRASQRSLRANRWLVSGDLGQARLEGLKEFRGRGTSYRLTYRLLQADKITFNVQRQEALGLVIGGVEWCLYERAHPERAILLAELPALPKWAQKLVDRPAEL